METIASLKATIRKLQLDLYHKDLSLEETKQKIRGELADEVKKELKVLLLEKDDEISRLNQHIVMQDARMKRLQSGNIIVEKVGIDEDKETIKSLLEENQRLQDQFEEVSDKLIAIDEKMLNEKEKTQHIEHIKSLTKAYDNDTQIWKEKETTYKETIKKLEWELDTLSKDQVRLEEALKKPKRKSAKQIELEKEVETMREEFMLVLAEKETEIDDLKEQIKSMKTEFEKQNKHNIETIEDLACSFGNAENTISEKNNEICDLRNLYEEKIIDQETELCKLREKVTVIEDIETKNALLTSRLMEREKHNSKYVKHLEQTIEQLRQQY
jgi:hypothetical protein